MKTSANDDAWTICNYLFNQVADSAFEPTLKQVKKIRKRECTKWDTTEFLWADNRCCDKRKIYNPLNGLFAAFEESHPKPQTNFMGL